MLPGLFDLNHSKKSLCFFVENLDFIRDFFHNLAVI